MTIGTFERSECDAEQFGGTPSYVDGHCTCLTCDRCGHHTGNSMFGHYGYACRVLTRQLAARPDRGGLTMPEFIEAVQRPEPHFCCPDEHGCEYEHEKKEETAGDKPGS